LRRSWAGSLSRKGWEVFIFMSEPKPKYKVETCMDNKIKDRSNDRIYRIETPQIVWSICADIYEFMLWTVIKMIAGEAGECYLSTDDLAAAAMMSTGKASQCRKSLIKKGLIEGEIRKDPGYPQPVWHLMIPDLWPRNVSWRQKHNSLLDRIVAKREQRQSLHQMKASSDEEGPPPGEEGPSPGETKKEPERSNQKGKPNNTIKETSPSPSPRQASQAMFSALAQTCQIDLTLMTSEQRGQLNQSEKRLRKAGILPEDLQGFGQWWFANDWRGKKGQPPTPAQVRSEWGKFTAWKKKAQTGNRARYRDQADEGPSPAPAPAKTPDQELWSKILTNLEMQLTRASSASWLHDTTATRTNGTLTITVANDRALDWLENRLRETIERTVARVVGQPLEVVFCLPE